MVSVRASPAFFTIGSLAPGSGAKSANRFGFAPKEIYTRGLDLKANVHAPLGANGTKVRTNDYEDIQFDEKQMARFGSGAFLPNSHIHRQYFPVRSYEIGPNGTITLETLISLLQESGINCVKGVGIEVDGLALTPEMCRRNIIWVMAKIQVEIDRYPTCGDFLEVDNWSATLGRTGIRRDSLIRDYKTGHTLLRASSYWLFINKETKKVVRMPDDLRETSAPYLMDSDPIVKDDGKEFPELDGTTADYICGGLKPRWSDLDGSQHVNNAKYIGWILEPVPWSILENYELCGITMEYKRECHLDCVVQSMTSTSSIESTSGPTQIQFSHLLTIENGPEIMKARTSWRPKSAHVLGNFI